MLSLSPASAGGRGTARTIPRSPGTSSNCRSCLGASFVGSPFRAAAWHTLRR